MAFTNTLKGKYTPLNPSKYRGDASNCVYRSSWERKLMFYLDNSKSIVQWASEEIVIPYLSPVDNKWHRYFPDFWIKAIDKDSKIFEAIIEIKPENQVKQPVQKSQQWAHRKRFLTEVATWAINQAKWKAAERYCSDRNWKFMVLTEKTINGKLKSTTQ